MGQEKTDELTKLLLEYHNEVVKEPHDLSPAEVYAGVVLRVSQINQILELTPEELEAWAKANVYANLADIKAIMKNVPDLRSLERQLANYLGERRRLETDTD